jgi:hypothetical protein
VGCARSQLNIPLKAKQTPLMTIVRTKDATSLGVLLAQIDTSVVNLVRRETPAASCRFVCEKTL